MDERLFLDFAWKKRLELWVNGNKLSAEGHRLSAEGHKRKAESNKLIDEGLKLWAKGNKLRAEGNNLWAEAILSTYGNVKLQWKNWNDKYQSSECHLDNGLVFGFPE